jgi:hypothetical protein
MENTPLYWQRRAHVAEDALKAANKTADIWNDAADKASNERDELQERVKAALAILNAVDVTDERSGWAIAEIVREALLMHQEPYFPPHVFGGDMGHVCGVEYGEYLCIRPKDHPLHVEKT